MAERCEFELFVKPVGIAGRKNPSPKALQFGVLETMLLHQHLADAAAAYPSTTKTSPMYANVALSLTTGKGDLPLAIVNAEAHRIFDRRLGLLKRSLTCPIGLFDQKSMDAHVELRLTSVIEIVMGPLTRSGTSFSAEPADRATHSLQVARQRAEFIDQCWSA